MMFPDRTLDSIHLSMGIGLTIHFNEALNGGLPRVRRCRAFIRDWGNPMRLRAWQPSLLCAILIAGFPLTADAAGKDQLFSFGVTCEGGGRRGLCCSPRGGGGIRVCT